MSEAFDIGPPPDSVIAYISDMLTELAAMASADGRKSLAVAIRLVGLQALRERTTAEQGAPGDKPAR